MCIYQSEFYHNEDGNRGEITKVSDGFLVKKYRDFFILYYSKRFSSYASAKKALTSDGFAKDRDF